MNNENINKEFDPGKDFAEQYNEILSKINVGSPVHKVNFDDLSENNILGMFLLSEDGAMELLSEAVDKSNVNKNTYLFFESTHVVECCQILIGAFIALNDNPSIDKEFDYNDYLIDPIMKNLLHGSPIRYKDLKSILNNACSDALNYIKENADTIYRDYLYLLNNIWFVPYGKIDDLNKIAIKEYSKILDKMNGEESDGKN